MNIPLSVLIALLAMSLLFLVATSEAVLDKFFVASPKDCDRDVSNTDCFAEWRELPAQQVQGRFDLSVQATQSIVADEVQGNGLSARILRAFGSNTVPQYPLPDARGLFASGEFKTHNKLVIVGVVRDGYVEIQDWSDEAQPGQTDLLIAKINGKVFNNGPFRVNGTPSTSLPVRISNGVVDYCFLGGIHRIAALAHGGRRIVIGSRVELHISAAGDRATIVPVVRASRFPTTFLWSADAFSHGNAEAIAPVLKACSSLR